MVVLFTMPRDLKNQHSVLWDQVFDPYQLFEVNHGDCHILEVLVIRGIKISKGWASDLLDTPDPYITLKIPGTPNGIKKTRHVDNCTSPEWNEEFQFCLNLQLENILEIRLMDYNVTKDEELGMYQYPIPPHLINYPRSERLTFRTDSQILIRLQLKKSQSSDIRYSLALCQEEKNFLRRRRLRVFRALRKLLGPQGPRSIHEVPIVGVLGSGGGFRAMIGLSGALKALEEHGYLDCCTYLSGLSGSSWFISSYYVQEDKTRQSVANFQNQLRECMSRNWKRLLSPPSLYRYVQEVISKSLEGQPVSFVDLFGHLLGDTLLKDNKKIKLSDLCDKINRGDRPFPLFSCVHVKRNVSAQVYQEYVEFSPYEVGIAKYGCFLKTKHFGSKFYMGKVIRDFPEYPLHFLQGIWGSAFSILFRRILTDRKAKDVAERLREQAMEEDLARKELESYTPVDAIEDNNNSGTSSEDEVEDHSDTDYEDSYVRYLRKPRHRLRKKADPPRRETSANDGTLVEGTTSRGSTEDHPKWGSKAETNGWAITSLLQSIAWTVDFATKFVAQQGLRMLAETGRNTHPRLSRQNAMGLEQEHVKTNPSGVMSTLTRFLGRRSRKERRMSRKESKKQVQTSFWEQLIQKAVIKDNRTGRSAVAYNFMRGLTLAERFPISPLDTVTTPEDGEAFKGSHEPLRTDAKKLYLVDSGLTFNSPYPLLLRPQRGVQLYLSFDFSRRPSDSTPPFKELLLAEIWAKKNNVDFPPIEEVAKQYCREPIREYYVFRHPTDTSCPVILHFPIVNNLFMHYKEPGLPRSTVEEKQFSDFKIFSDPANPYSIYNFVYTQLQFDRLAQLMEFNCLLGLADIKQEFIRLVRLNRRAREEINAAEYAEKICEKIKYKRMFAFNRSPSNPPLRRKPSSPEKRLNFLCE